MFIRTLDARAAANAASELGLPIWVGYSITESADGDLCLGLRQDKHGNETIKEAVELGLVDRIKGKFEDQNFILSWKGK